MRGQQRLRVDACTHDGQTEQVLPRVVVIAGGLVLLALLTGIHRAAMIGMLAAVMVTVRRARQVCGVHVLSADVAQRQVELVAQREVHGRPDHVHTQAQREGDEDPEPEGRGRSAGRD